MTCATVNTVAEWGVLQLRETTDPVAVADVERDLKARWADVVCRFPAVKQDMLDRDNPLSLYVFVQVPLSPKLERSTFATRFLRDPVTRKLLKVTDAELAEMTPLPLLPPPGTLIQITAGDWSGLTATVVDTNCTHVTALLELWSKKRVLTLAPNEFQLA